MAAAGQSRKRENYPTSLKGLSRRQQEEHLNRIERHILEMFGLKSRPKPGKNRLVPQHVLDLLKERQEGKMREKVSHRISLTGSANTVRSHDYSWGTTMTIFTHLLNMTYPHLQMYYYCSHIFLHSFLFFHTFLAFIPYLFTENPEVTSLILLFLLLFIHPHIQSSFIPLLPFPPILLKKDILFLKMNSPPVVKSTLRMFS